jgi:hypothetical protein
MDEKIYEGHALGRRDFIRTVGLSSLLPFISFSNMFGSNNEPTPNESSTILPKKQLEWLINSMFGLTPDTITQPLTFSDAGSIIPLLKIPNHYSNDQHFVTFIQNDLKQNKRPFNFYSISDNYAIPHENDGYQKVITIVDAFGLKPGMNVKRKLVARYKDGTINQIFESNQGQNTITHNFTWDENKVTHNQYRDRENIGSEEYVFKDNQIFGGGYGWYFHKNGCLLKIVDTISDQYVLLTPNKDKTINYDFMSAGTKDPEGTLLFESTKLNRLKQLNRLNCFYGIIPWEYGFQIQTRDKIIPIYFVSREKDQDKGGVFLGGRSVRYNDAKLPIYLTFN